MICFCGNFDKAVVNMAFMEFNVTFRVLLTVKTPYATCFACKPGWTGTFCMIGMILRK